jgi:DNA replication protein DnaC
MDLAKKMEKIGSALKAKNANGKADFDLMRKEAIEESNAEIQFQVIKRFLEMVPTIYYGKKFDDFKVDYPSQKRIKEIAMRYVDTFQERKQEGMNLIFTGSSGTGKTLLSLIMYQALAKKNVRVRYEANLQFLRDFRDRNFLSNESFKQIVNNYREIEFLVIDEVTEGLVKGGELCQWEKEMLFTIINMRYQANLCTLVITNRDINDFKTQMTDRIAGRLLEKGLTLAFDWSSYR